MATTRVLCVPLLYDIYNIIIRYNFKDRLLFTVDFVPTYNCLFF